MANTQYKVEHKGFSTPDEIRSFEKGKMELVKMAGGEVGRLILEPGWQWSKHVKPIANTEWCMAPHFQYIVSGKIRVKMKSGEEFELGPGDLSYLPEGHDAWVVGNDAVVAVDWAGATNYGKK